MGNTKPRILSLVYSWSFQQFIYIWVEVIPGIEKFLEPPSGSSNEDHLVNTYNEISDDVKKILGNPDKLTENPDKLTENPDKLTEMINNFETKLIVFFNSFLIAPMNIEQLLRCINSIHKV